MDETFEQAIHRYWGQLYLRILLWLWLLGEEL